jgi:HK97 family phage prohead protease
MFEAWRHDQEALLERRHDLRVLNSRLAALGLRSVSLPTEISEHLRETARAKRRSFGLQAADINGRVVEGRIVPYYVTATVSDAGGEKYRERFVHGAFSHQVNQQNRPRVLLDVEHSRSIGSVVGHDLELREASDGLHGRFRLLENRDADQALELIRVRLLRGMSIEFKPLRSRRVGDVIERLDCQLDRVALCRVPAYDDARLVAVGSAA